MDEGHSINVTLVTTASRQLKETENSCGGKDIPCIIPVSSTTCLRGVFVCGGDDRSIQIIFLLIFTTFSLCIYHISCELFSFMLKDCHTLQTDMMDSMRCLVSSVQGLGL